jgi:hypothetical protein
MTRLNGNERDGDGDDGESVEWNGNPSRSLLRTMKKKTLMLGLRRMNEVDRAA